MLSGLAQNAVTVLAILFFVLAVVEGAILFGGYHMHLKLGDERKRVWQFVEELESDKRALTESLCRAEGKPFIPVGRRELVASDGWFDGKTQIKVADPRAS